MSDNPPSCWSNGTCLTPIGCYLHGCNVTGYQTQTPPRDRMHRVVESKVPVGWSHSPEALETWLMDEDL